MKTRYSVLAVIIIFSAIVMFNSSIAKADVHVYDNNNQYLGLLIDLGDSNLEIFIPSLKANWSYDLGELSSCLWEYPIFNSGNCSGTPYSDGPLPEVYDLTGTSLGAFYIPQYAGRTTFTPGSYYDENCQCQPNVFYPNTEYYPLTEVQMPFTTPVALPLRFEVKNRAVVIPLN
ncbi:MAG: hypothetical protein JSW04_02410 [Desulfobacterales bacterium]|nr:MAG: hypothetical protein JSW04_02410 [Desulfobacterales bacterium]